MSQDAAFEPGSSAIAQTGETQKSEPEQNKSCEKKPYKKPELRKYAQIDYVTAYGVD